jgi:predicted TIM-barrel fold metal-dependent hydrolase
MNAPLREQKAAQKLMIVDCDIHPIQRSAKDLYPFLSKHWQEHLETFGGHVRQGMTEQVMWPRMMALGQRADAYPAQGGPPGSDYELMKRQHLDLNGVEFGMLVALSKGGMEERNPDLARALSTAVNEWQLEAWVKRDARLKVGIVVTGEDPAHAVAEIEKRAGDSSFAQVILSPRSSEPLGRRRYWPIYAAAERAGLPVGLHPAAIPGGSASSGAGWPTYYMQEHHTFVTGSQATAVSLVMEGVFEEFPNLRIAMIEAGFSWAPALGWRMDRIWERMRKETPHLKRPPSEYMREHFWFATQPMEEPENPQDILQIFEWIGWDRIMFSTDYPHWDFDDPRQAVRVRLTDEQREKIFRANAKALYRLP